jgi:membrane protease YdiL (CAAX protease family)
LYSLARRNKISFSTDKGIMETSIQTPPTSDRYPQVASPRHTILFLAGVAGWSFWIRILTRRLSAAANPNRMRFYLVTLLLEWSFFLFVLLGVRSRGASVLLVLGDHWRSVRQVLLDIGIAAGFWLVALIVLRIFSGLLRITAMSGNLQALLPHSGAELTLWIAVSISAGICEETIFRGYLQRQFMALTKSAPVGIALSAAVFGAAHAYQGLRMVILIALFGAMFGILAYWRRSVRAGMIAHAWQDSLGGLVDGFMKH